MRRLRRCHALAASAGGHTLDLVGQGRHMERHVVGAGTQHLQGWRGTPLLALAAQPGGNHRDADVITQAVVVGGAVDHQRVGRGEVADGIHGQLGFAQLQRALAGRDQHQHALGTRQVHAFEQGAGNSLFCSNTGAVGATGGGCAHHGLAGFSHDGAHVFEVDVHMGWHVDDFRDAAHRVLQHVVGMRKGLVLGDVVAQHFFELFVEHDNQ